MWTKSISNILGMGIFGSCFLAANLPVQGEIMIQGGNLSGNLNYNYDNPIVPIANRFIAHFFANPIIEKFVF